MFYGKKISLIVATLLRFVISIVLKRSYISPSVWSKHFDLFDLQRQYKIR